MKTETYLQRRKRMYDETPLDVRQKFIDCIHEGMTIDGARKEAGIEDLDTACEILNYNILDYKSIRKEAANNTMDLQRLEELAGKATKGDWYTEERNAGV